MTAIILTVRCHYDAVSLSLLWSHRCHWKTRIWNIIWMDHVISRPLWNVLPYMQQLTFSLNNTSLLWVVSNLKKKIKHTMMRIYGEICAFVQLWCHIDIGIVGIVERETALPKMVTCLARMVSGCFSWHFAVAVLLLKLWSCGIRIWNRGLFYWAFVQSEVICKRTSEWWRNVITCACAPNINPNMIYVNNEQSRATSKR